MKAFWVDRNTNTACVAETDGGLKDLYEMCHCRCIDITVAEIEGTLFNVVVDDEGLLVDRPVATVFNRNGEPLLVGSVVFFGMDDETDDLASLSQRQIELLLNRTGMAVMNDFTNRCITIVDGR